jgi:ribosomal protein S28E/S33
MKVFVYKNLHATRQNSGITVYSVKALEGPDKGRVVARSSHVLLGDVVPKVSQAGRRRVLVERSKNVHAGLVGTLIHMENQPFHGEKITYNPYKYESFVMAAWDTVVYYGSELAYLSETGVKIIEPKG